MERPIYTPLGGAVVSRAVLAALVLLIGVLVPTARAAAEAPENLTLPVIKGTAQVGQTLTAKPGKWKGAEGTPTVQWVRCSEPTKCEAITGQTGASYEPMKADEGDTIKVEETASNAAAEKTTASSKETAKVLPEAPVNEAPPSIGGTAQVGQTLTETPGKWKNNPTLIDKWLRCNGKGEECSVIAEGTTTYIPVEADIGHTFEIEEKATNTGGNNTTSSGAYGPVVAIPPENESPPTITGIAQLGQTLTENPGKWKNNPILIDKWQRCNSNGEECSVIAEASPTYIPVEADIGHVLEIAETAQNSGGQGKALSRPTSPVIALVTIVETPKQPPKGPGSSTKPPPVRVPVPLVSLLRTRLVHNTTLEVRFRLTVKARTRLVARKGKKVVAHTPLRVLTPGMHKLLLKLNRHKWPTKIELQAHALAALPTVVQGG